MKTLPPFHFYCKNVIFFFITGFFSDLPVGNFYANVACRVMFPPLPESTREGFWGSEGETAVMISHGNDEAEDHAPIHPLEKVIPPGHLFQGGGCALGSTSGLGVGRKGFGLTSRPAQLFANSFGDYHSPRRSHRGSFFGGSSRKTPPSY